MLKIILIGWIVGISAMGRDFEIINSTWWICQNARRSWWSEYKKERYQKSGIELSTNIEELISDNNIVFIDITADWCATCQYNKINVLNKKKIKDIFKKYNIILVRGDWTKPNEKINQFLNKYNRFGIPFNGFYSKKYTEGILLSELLSEKEILNNINIINNDWSNSRYHSAFNKQR